MESETYIAFQENEFSNLHFYIFPLAYTQRKVSSCCFFFSYFIFRSFDRANIQFEFEISGDKDELCRKFVNFNLKSKNLCFKKFN